MPTQRNKHVLLTDAEKAVKVKELKSVLLKDVHDITREIGPRRVCAVCVPCVCAVGRAVCMQCVCAIGAIVCAVCVCVHVLNVFNVGFVVSFATLGVLRCGHLYLGRMNTLHHILSCLCSTSGARGAVYACVHVHVPVVQRGVV